ncbi:unnamed protein product [Hermetia illucens]|uniref:Uncharacterized protein n=1 Tax=Hermetia illucens TaxID=343691 RepID=A0A7R8V0Y1_HERIL|nr:unnamed protein product [Hermetia illucens]
MERLLLQTNVEFEFVPRLFRLHRAISVVSCLPREFHFVRLLSGNLFSYHQHQEKSSQSEADLSILRIVLGNPM